ncbi:putative kinase-like protein TMKL1 [Magnolia sinica]|uniref:putative kinase-like protein TMKL1 n=1 Tax=Magnolia sinica TaxID=86752 RepID=UPI00265A9C3F|nr:putative kinase-like protein TMKL1 [Magnolia sinica]
MEKRHEFKLILGSISAFLLLVLFLIAYILRWKPSREESIEVRNSKHVEEFEAEDLIGFPGGEDLTVHDILDAPGEVVGKSSYGTLYQASLQRSGSVVLLQFLRPSCAGRANDVLPTIRMMGFIRHSNLVPLQAFYVGPRGEKLLVHPFVSRSTLSQFLHDGTGESHRWTVIHNISLCIAIGLDHLHNGLQKSIIHGNLKSKNILLDSYYQPYLSDFGMHLLLKPSSAQEMLEDSADQGYKAPELTKMKDVSKESDIYSFGVIVLEILTGKEPTYGNSFDINLPTSMRNAIPNHKVFEIFRPELLNQSNHQNSITKEGLLLYLQLAIDCCSSPPSLRPDIKQIVRKLEEIGQQICGINRGMAPHMVETTDITMG